jgi:hypothetical protein
MKNTDKAAVETGGYGVWCQCSGLLGFREAWLKSNDTIRRFDTEAEAQAEAQRLMEQSKSPYSQASFNYYAKPIQFIT